MGSEGPQSIRFHVTGFKKFYGVPHNPTETIVENLNEFLRRRGMPRGVTLGSCTVLEAAGEGALPELYKVFEVGTNELLPGVENEERVVWLHLGANGGLTNFAIERQAVNEATFRCPDELGWQPQQLLVVPEDGGITQTRETSCRVDCLAKSLRRQGYDVVVSDDANRFVCNYIYYHSLRFSEQKGHTSLFIHLPLFSRIDEDTQMQFIAALLDTLAVMH